MREEAQGLFHLLKHFNNFDHSKAFKSKYEAFENDEPILCTYLNSQSMHVEIVRQVRVATFFADFSLDYLLEGQQHSRVA